MFSKTSHENLIFTEHWPASTSTLKGNFSKSFNSLCNNKIKSFSSLSNSTSLSNFHSGSFSNIYDTNNIAETKKNSSIFTSQGSLLNIIEEEQL